MNKAIIKLALDLTQGRQSYEYNGEVHNAAKAADILRKALIDANGGSTVVDRKTLRRNRGQIFDIIEEIIPVIVRNGFEGDEFWMNFVDERHVPLGDQNEFYLPDDTTFIVTKIADGIVTPDRQRLDHGRTLRVETSLHAVRMYDEFSRFMSGRIDWMELCEKVAKAFKKAVWADIYTAFSGISRDTIGLSNNFVISGTYSAADLRTLIARVEAATGERAALVGTKVGLAKCEGAEKADSAKESMHNAGFYGMFEGTPMIMLRQQFKPGTEEFLINDNILYVVAGSEKFIKLVFEGDTEIHERDHTVNDDHTVEYLTLMKWGVGIALAGKIGKYTLS